MPARTPLPAAKSRQIPIRLIGYYRLDVAVPSP
jgi:hypothetical protein